MEGGSFAEDKAVYHANGKWHVDMPLPPENGKPDPDAIYYDHPANGNLASKSKTNVEMFDRPTEDARHTRRNRTGG